VEIGINGEPISIESMDSKICFLLQSWPIPIFGGARDQFLIMLEGIGEIPPLKPLQRAGWHS